MVKRWVGQRNLPTSLSPVSNFYFLVLDYFYINDANDLASCVNVEF